MCGGEGGRAGGKGGGEGVYGCTARVPKIHAMSFLRPFRMFYFLRMLCGRYVGVGFVGVASVASVTAPSERASEMLVLG